MIDKITDIRNMLRQDIHTGKKFDGNVRIIRLCMLFFAVIMTFFVFYNYQQKLVIAMYMCALLSVVSLLVAAMISKPGWRNRCGWIIVILTAGILTLYTIDGTNGGFAILWSLLIPVGIMYFLDVRIGLIECIYLELVFIICFYTPLREKIMTGKYSEIFMLRYPILYGTATVIIGIAMIQYHILSLRQQEYDKLLENEVTLQKQKSKERKEKLNRLSFQMVEALVGAIDAKDTYTNGHSNRVACYSQKLALRLGLPDEKAEEIYIAAILHDIGKIGVPDEIINKPSKLTNEEYDIIKQHPAIGAQILGKIDEMPSARIGAHFHHERYDGNGYPKGLAGEDIPLEARIIAVADAYDAMTSNRSYRKYLPQDVVRAEITNNRGAQFDPHIADCMLEIMDEDVSYILHE